MITEKVREYLKTADLSRARAWDCAASLAMSDTHSGGGCVRNAHPTLLCCWTKSEAGRWDCSKETREQIHSVLPVCAA